MPRQPNGRPSIYLGKDGWYHCYFTVGRKPGGKLDRRHIRGRTATEVADKLEQLEAKLRIGHVPEIGKAPTLGTWIEHYLTTIAPRKVRRSTLQGYESYMRGHVIPALGNLKLSTPVVELAEAIEAFFRQLERKVSRNSALQVYRVLSRMLKVAAQRGKLPRNPCELVDPPVSEFNEVDPIAVDEAKRILTEAARAGALARWWVAMMLGLRQGEALGLLWDHVDLDGDAPSLRVWWELIRLKWRHGCDAEPCGRATGAACPQRHGGGLVWERPKSRKGRRTLPLPPTLVEVLKAHRREQRKARLKAGPAWVQIDGPEGETGGLVFAGPRGRAILPENDRKQWKAILVAAGVRAVERVHQHGADEGQTYRTSTVRVHDARHGAGTVMFAGGMERQELMEWLGHAQISVSARYTHVPEELMRERAKFLDGLWKSMLEGTG